jgi:NitT/TauT family transport system ATP-binding protein
VQNVGVDTTGSIDSDAALLSFEGVGKVFRTPHPLRVLEGIDLGVAEAEFACLLGPSGCGKSTLLNIAAGFELPSEGRALFRGQSILRPSPERAVVFQEPALFPWLRVLDNITFSPRLAGRPRGEYLPIAEEYVRLVGLAGFERHFPAELSGGMKQRVGIARVLIMEPTVLLMDEPFGALDSQTRSLMQELILRLWDQFHQTVLFITHDVDEALLLSDTVHVMTARPGRIKRRLRIELPRPRTVDLVTSTEFNDYKRELMAAIRDEALRSAGERGREMIDGISRSARADGSP